MTARRWMLPVLGGLTTTGLGVAINLATELKSNPWAWMAVAVLTVAGIIVGLGSERLTRNRRADGSIVNHGTMVTVAGNKNRVKVNVMGPGSVIVVCVVVIVAVVAGLLTGRATTTNSGQPGPATGSSTGETATKPFNVLVLDDPTDDASRTWYGFSAGYAFPPGTVPSLPPPHSNNCSDWSTWALSKGGVRIYKTTIGFTVSALGDQTVRVHAARLHTEEQKRQAVGDMVQCAKGGPIPISYLSIDLDRKQATYMHPGDGPQGGQSRPFALEIPPGKSEYVEVEAISQKCYCSWYLDVLIEANGVNYNHRVDDDGKPFVNAPLDGKYQVYQLDPETLRWVPGFR